jgi:hypothetical protein
MLVTEMNGMKILQAIGVTVLGIIVGGLVVAGVESIGLLISDAPSAEVMNDRAKLAEFIAGKSVAAFAPVMAAHALGTFVASYLARRLAPERWMAPGIVAGGMLLLGGVANLTMLPHPLWMAATSLSALAGGTAMGTWAAGRRPKAAGAT